MGEDSLGTRDRCKNLRYGQSNENKNKNKNKNKKFDIIVSVQ
jgi:hypothetical protein